MRSRLLMSATAVAIAAAAMMVFPSLSAAQMPPMGGGYTNVIAIPVDDPATKSIAGALLKPTGAGPRIRPQHRVPRWYQLDLNIERDRVYLIGRGFAFAVIARGDRRGKVVSAHRTRALAELAAKAFGGKNPPEIVEIATFA
jgi:hypothetical protein